MSQGGFELTSRVGLAHRSTEQQEPAQSTAHVWSMQSAAVSILTTVLSRDGFYLFLIGMGNAYYIHVFYRYPFNVDQEVSSPDWEVYTRKTASMIVEEQSPAWLASKTVQKPFNWDRDVLGSARFSIFSKAYWKCESVCTNCSSTASHQRWLWR